MLLKLKSHDVFLLSLSFEEVEELLLFVVI